MFFHRVYADADFFFFFSSRRRHTRFSRDWSSDVCSSDLQLISEVARRELTLRSLGVERRLALEMAVDERAEVAELERHWREAEEIAEIADGTLSSDPLLEEELERIRKKLGREPESS